MENEYQPENQMAESSRNIPHEVLFGEILVRLPVKSLAVFKSVCKPWLCTIESLSFREIHRRRHILDYSDQILFSSFKSVSDPVAKSTFLEPSTHSFGQGPIKMTFRPLGVMLPPEITRIEWPEFKRPWKASVSILGPLRTTGIYCVVAYLFRDRVFHCLPNAKISICNPATRDYKLANPLPPKETARLLDITTRQYCNVNYGFGLAADGDYKVVIIMSWRAAFACFLSYVYSLKQGTWKKIVDSENDMVSRLDLRGMPRFPEILDIGELCPQDFLNSCWHWMAVSQDCISSVLSFHVDNEAFKSVQGPPGYRGCAITEGDITSRITRSQVSVLNDHLAALYHSYNMSSDRMGVISVWMMMEYGHEESWVNVWTVNLDCGPIKTLVGISYSLREDGNGGVHIHRIVFLEDSGEQLVCCDESGEVEYQPGFDSSKISSCIFWNNLGISAYSETLERL